MEKILSLICALILLTACESNIRHAIGLEKELPQEFKVMPSKPLYYPPSYSELPEIQSETTQKFEPTSFSKNDFSKSEQNLLDKANIAEESVNIREILHQDYQLKEEMQEKGFWDFW